MQTRSRSGQGMIEYLMIFVIIMAGVFLGGPVLVNSIGARFQGMSDTSQDSIDENIQLAAAAACSCNPQSPKPEKWPPASTVCKSTGCGELEKRHERECVPLMCGQAWGCVEYTDCCLKAVRGTACGTVIAGSLPDLCVSREAISVPLTFPDPPPAGPVQGRCIDAAAGVRGCLTTEREYTAECGKKTWRYACVANDGCP